MKDAYPKRVVKLSIARDVLAAARRHGLDLLATLDRAVVDRVRQIEAESWLAENRTAIEKYNERVDREGVFSDDLRPF
jgi:antitoxin CcdA